jgi:hypothetical protein
MADGAEAALHHGAEAAKDALEDVLNIVFEWIVPIIVLLVGFYVGSGVGLSGALYGLLDGVMPKSITQSTLTWVADLVAIAIYAAIGAGLWHAAGSRKIGSDGMDIKMWVLRPLAALLFGFAGAEAANLLRGQVSTGALSTAATKMSAGAKA